MARPCGAQRKALLEALDEAPGTSGQLARRAGIDATTVWRTLDNMVRRGVPQAVVLRHERVPGVKRPVPVYGRLHDPDRADAANDAGVAAAFAQIGMALFGPKAEEN